MLHVLVMLRYLQSSLVEHCRDDRQMLFLSGPRQVGKTTVAQMLGADVGESFYLNWDNLSHREVIVRGPDAVASHAELDRLRNEPPLCIFDELHKYQHWRTFLKGLFDEYQEQLRVVVTGSASLATFRRGGDSLMGRYFPFTLHPISVAELVGAQGRLVIQEPKPISDDAWAALHRFGGFPEPFLKADQRFYNRWRSLRTEQLLREDVRDLTRIQELGQIELLAKVLSTQVGQLTSYSYLAKHVRVSVDTIRRWIATLESLYFCFAVRPWHQNVTRALRKEPKYYLWDWSLVEDVGARHENLVASALLKATHWWTETGMGQFVLHFVRDKEKREVDFLVTRDGEPWFLAEVKTSAKARISPSLEHFQQQTCAQHAFQVAVDAAFVEADCFSTRLPTVVPARTFLAQLV